MNLDETRAALSVRVEDLATFLYSEAERGPTVLTFELVTIQTVGVRRGRWSNSGIESRDLLLLWAYLYGYSQVEGWEVRAAREAGAWLEASFPSGNTEQPSAQEPQVTEAPQYPPQSVQPMIPAFDLPEPDRPAPLPPQQQRKEPPMERQAPKHRITYPQDFHREFPQAPDAERGVLGSIAVVPDCLDRALEAGITAESFYIPAHGQIFEAFIALRKAEKPIEFITLLQFLQDRNQLAEVGGPAVLSELFLTATAANLNYYADIILEKQLLRDAIQVCNEFSARAYEEQHDPAALVNEMAAEMGKVATGSKRRSSLPPWEDAAGAIHTLPPLPPELIAGLLHQGAKLVLGGASKSNKTWSLLDMAISVATGSPWWDMATTQGPVLYLNLEIAPPFFARRIKTVSEAKGAPIKPGQLTIWNLRGHSCDIGKLSTQILPDIKAGKFSLVILDPIYKCLGDRDENAAGQIAGLLNQIEHIAVESGAAIAFGAHYSKGNQAAKESIDRIGGSGVFARDPDAILTLTRHEQDDAFTCEPVLRNHAPHNPFVLRWEWPLMRRDDSLDPAQLKKPPGRESKPTKTKEDLKALIPMTGTIAKKTLLAKAGAIGIGVNKAREFITLLIHEGAAFEHRIPRPGTNAEVHIGRHEPTLL